MYPPAGHPEIRTGNEEVDEVLILHRRDGDDDLFDSLFQDDAPQIVAVPHGLDPIHLSAKLSRVIVDKANRPIAQARVVQHFAHEHLTYPR